MENLYNGNIYSGESDFEEVEKILERIENVEKDLRKAKKKKKSNEKKGKKSKKLKCKIKRLKLKNKQLKFFVETFATRQSGFPTQQKSIDWKEILTKNLPNLIGLASVFIQSNQSSGMKVLSTKRIEK